jgi:hypothetical protein
LRPATPPADGSHRERPRSRGGLSVQSALARTAERATELTQRHAAEFRAARVQFQIAVCYFSS